MVTIRYSQLINDFLIKLYIGACLLTLTLIKEKHTT